MTDTQLITPLVSSIVFLNLLMHSNSRRTSLNQVWRSKMRAQRAELSSLPATNPAATPAPTKEQRWAIGRKAAAAQVGHEEEMKLVR